MHTIHAINLTICRRPLRNELCCVHSHYHSLLLGSTIVDSRVGIARRMVHRRLCPCEDLRQDQVYPRSSRPGEARHDAAAAQAATRTSTHASSVSRKHRHRTCGDASLDFDRAACAPAAVTRGRTRRSRPAPTPVAWPCGVPRSPRAAPEGAARSRVARSEISRSVYIYVKP
jgi:hypothetical protein